MDLDAGWHVTCGVDDVGGLWCWGRNQDGVVGKGDRSLVEATPLQIEASGWRDVSVGYRFACGVKADDTLWCWGWQEGGRLGNGVDSSVFLTAPTRSGEDADWLEVDTSDNSSSQYGHACGLRTDGTIWCWGSNWRGQLGTGDKDDSLTPVQAGSDEDWVQVSVGALSTCARKEDGAGYCWGIAQSQQLGSFVGAESTTPVEILEGASWTDVAMGNAMGCGVREDGSLWCWGVVNCCNGTLPTQFGADTDWVDVGVNVDRLCATKTDGSLWCRSDNTYGQAGSDDGMFVSMLSPALGTGWSRVTHSENHTCGLDPVGRARCFGSNLYGELGNGASAVYGEPARLPYDDWAEVRTTENIVCGLRGDALWCWGRTSLQDVEFAKDPIEMDSVGWARIEGGAEAQCGLRAEDQSLWCWGRTYFNANVDSGFGDASVPFELVPDTAWLDVALGAANACAVRDDHTLWCWGRNDLGQLGNGTTDQSWKLSQVETDTDWAAVAAGAHAGNDGTVCGIRMDGSLWCWGGTVAKGLTGSGQDSNPTPALIDAARDWVDVALGFQHLCGIDSTGALYCAGRNNNGQLGDPDRPDPDWTLERVGTDEWISLAADAYLTCAVRADTTVWCWGNAGLGQLGNGIVGNSIGASYVQATPLQTSADAGWQRVHISDTTTFMTKDDGEAFALGWFLESNAGRGEEWTHVPQWVEYP
jgi:alpha-tubulin suppressor-like RCC1 family protein